MRREGGRSELRPGNVFGRRRRKGEHRRERGALLRRCVPDCRLRRRLLSRSILSSSTAAPPIHIHDGTVSISPHLALSGRRDADCHHAAQRRRQQRTLDEIEFRVAGRALRRRRGGGGDVVIDEIGAAEVAADRGAPSVCASEYVCIYGAAAAADSNFFSTGGGKQDEKETLL